MAGLQITLGAHVVIHIAQIGLKLLAMQYVLSLESGNETGLFYILHRATKCSITKNGVAFELNLDHTDALTFIDNKSKGCRRIGNLFPSLFDGCVWMAASRQ